MTSTSFNVGLNTATRNSSKVLKPPGGGSSDIFGVADANEPQRGRRNHNISSFSLGTEEVVTPARKPESNAGGDSSSTNGSTSSIESTPAPTPTPSGGASAPAKQRVPPGGFSSGLW